MTLCLAWKYKGKIHFASDSRLSIENDLGVSYADIGVKVLDIPVKIYYPISSESNAPEIAYDHKLGMCYSANDVYSAHLLKETVSYVLQSLQFTPGYSEFSLRGICKLIEKFIANIANELWNGLEWETNIEFLIGGYCPEEQKVLVYKFELNYIEEYEVLVNEVLTEEDEWELLGIGTDAALKLLPSDTVLADFEMLKVLREVCNNDDVPDVGGYLQYGKFGVDNNFKLYGVVDYEVDEHNNQLEFLFTYRGVVLYKNRFEITNEGLHIKLDFIMPFEDETNKLLDNAC